MSTFTLDIVALMAHAASRVHVPGIIQAPGGKCADHWHCCGPDQIDHGCNPGPECRATDAQPHGLGAVDSTCPSCGAVMMSGGAVWPAFAAEYKRRLAESICLRSRGGKFLCDRKVKPALRALGACICAVHDRQSARQVARAESAEYERTIEQDHR